MKGYKQFIPLRTSDSAKSSQLIGFTLIELLIASSIFSIIMITVYSAFHTGIFGYKDIEKTVDVYQAARQVLGRINLDLRNSFAYSENEAKFLGNNSGISFLTTVDTFYNEKAVPVYAFVAYQVEGEKIMRLCRQGQESLNENSQIEPEEMAKGLESIIFRYGYVLGGDQDIKWKDTWGAAGDSPEEQKILPNAVKVKLTIKNDVKYSFERTIFLPLGAVR